MEQIKLEVGKTYLSRQGVEVRIVRKTANGRPPYQGSNGEWYTESGDWDVCGAGNPEDLIEEVTRHTFKIPDGAKQVGNRIVVEIVPEAPKPGDVMVNTSESVYIFKEVVDKDIHKPYVWLGRSGRLVYNDAAISGRPATPEEAKPLFDALKKAGKRWDAKTMQVEDVPEFDLILEWVEANIKDGYYNHEDVAEAIEGYLKHKEGEK